MIKLYNINREFGKQYHKKLKCRFTVNQLIPYFIGDCFIMNNTLLFILYIYLSIFIKKNLFNYAK